MKVNQEQDQEGDRRQNTVPAGLRTPDEFLEAIQRYALIEAEPTMLEERDRLAEAIRSAPFVIHGDEVVAKGFRGSVAK